MTNSHRPLGGRPARTPRWLRSGLLLLGLAALALPLGAEIAPGAPFTLLDLRAPCGAPAPAPGGERLPPRVPPSAGAAEAAQGTPRVSLWLEFAPGDSAESWIVAMPSNRADAVWLYADPESPPLRLDSADRRAWNLSVRQLGVELPAHRAHLAYVCFDGEALVEEELAAGPAPAFRARDLASSGRSTLAFGILVAMGLFSISFLVALKERVFLRYFAYLSAFLLFLACETRTAQRLPLLERLSSADLTRLSGVAIDLASGLAILFVLDFTQIRRRTPRTARVLRVVAAILLPLGAVHGLAYLAGWNAGVEATVHLSNLLVAAATLLLLTSGLSAALHGDRYARFFLVGWTPLLVAASVASLQQLAWSRTTDPALDGLLFAGAFESVVLSLGLADRTLSYRRELDRARELADRDALSGLLNRRALLRLSDALAADSRRWGSTLSVVMFDLDHFKRVNDEYGHAAGDVCIQRVAEELTSEARGSDLVARYGGEEFVAVLPGAPAVSARSYAERVRRRVAREPIVVEGAAIGLTVSAGVATGRSNEDVEKLLAAADQALYRAKHGGRDRVEG